MTSMSPPELMPLRTDSASRASNSMVFTRSNHPKRSRLLRLRDAATTSCPFDNRAGTNRDPM